MERLVANVTKRFDLTLWCILGGDVTVWGLEKLTWFITMLGKYDAFYAIVSNSTLVNPMWAKHLVEHGLTNWTISVDPKSLEDRETKAHAGWRAAGYFKTLGLQDIHATVTLDGQNFTGVIELVERLTEWGIWAEITPLIYGKGPGYDYGTQREFIKPLLFTKMQEERIGEVMEKLIEMKAGGYLIHNLDKYLRAWQDFVVDLHWKCKNNWNLTIEPDGTIKPCLHLHGDEIRQYNLLDENLDYQQVITAWQRDQDKQCKGCLWNCQYEAEYVFLRTGSLKAVRQYFEHGCKAVEKEYGL
jgi:sulfatase maturation enzyme AslB (radical SAM superfamily)